jgi:hypothetical protein
VQGWIIISCKIREFIPLDPSAARFWFGDYRTDFLHCVFRADWRQGVVKLCIDVG